ncbi:MAG: hypothetical protein HN718_00220 [Rhodospirillales bacterium]|nr:hypothetical protein [Rhodospirillales bacterium]MBT5350481.1 hypothetical protein [Rhodospirillales bacterium]MBT5519646.1 hypothetical protein [Rhodospirillales bacterium]MBT6110613.1 hypothetical protein [Rhodospirillales bacterium]MBT7145469.1 hypothetical protein [Rhodospirillales bacterium]
MTKGVHAQTVLIEPEAVPVEQPQIQLQVPEQDLVVPEPMVPQSLEAVEGKIDLTMPSGTGTDKWAPEDQPVGSIGLGDSSIEVDELTTVSSDSIGLLTEEQGGLPYTVWRGTRFEIVDDLMARLPVGTTSPALRRVMRRLLISEAALPDNASGNGDFIARRLEVLSAMGEVAAARDLLAVTPGRNANERLLRVESDVALNAGRFVEACGAASSVVAEGANDYWQKLFIFCQVLAGATAEADLSLALMRELGAEEDELLMMLDSMIRGEIPMLNSLKSQSPLNMAVLRASNARLAEDAIEIPSPVILAAIATNRDMDIGTRLAAGEMAAASAALPVSDHRNLYASVPFTQGEMESPISTAGNLNGPMARALLFQAAQKQTVPGAKAEAAALALEIARRDDLYASTADAYLNIIASVAPRSDLIWFAGDAVRAFVLTGNAGAARGWLQMLELNALRSDAAMTALTSLVPVVRLASLGNDELPSQVGMPDWLNAMGTEENWRQRVALLFSLLDNLGEPVDPQSWESLGFEDSDNGMTLIDPALWYRLAASANGGRVGETVLLASLILGQGGPGMVDSITMGHVIRSLSATGLYEEARTLAIEAAIAGGL